MVVNFFLRIKGDETFRNRVCFPLWALLTAFAYPMFNLPLIWISYIPLIYALHKTSLKKSAFWIFWCSLLYYTATLYWLIAFHEAAAFFVFPVSAITLTVFLLFARYVAHRMPFLRFVSVPLFITAFELFRSIGFMGFRWNNVADALWNQIIFLQSADIVGWAGVGFLVLLCNSVVAEAFLLWEEDAFRRDFYKSIFPIYVGLFCFFGNLFYGISSYVRWTRIIDKELDREKVALIQPNRPGSFGWKAAEGELFQKFETMVQEAKKQDADLIVQTEIMTQDYLWQNLKFWGKNDPRNYYSSQLIELPKKYDVPMVLTHFDIDVNTRKMYNAATYVHYKNGEMQTNTYRKIHIVPFGEWIPGAKEMPWLKNFLESLGAAWASPGTDLTVMKTPRKTLFAVLICFEDIYAMLGRLFADKGVGFFVNATNDGWAYKWKLGAKAPLWQHLANTVHTSISLRRSIARSVNTGVSAVVDPAGRIDYSGIPEYTDGVYVASVPVMPISYRSPYTKGGWFLEYALFFLAAFVFMRLLISDKNSEELKKILE